MVSEMQVQVKHPENLTSFLLIILERLTDKYIIVRSHLFLSVN